MKTGLVQSLAQARDPSVYGDKAANLGRILRAGLATPQGVVISVHAFHTQLARSGIESSVARLRAGDEIGAARLRQVLLDSELDPELLRELSSTLVIGTRYAVRSSAPGEDGIASSFAGQFDSVLDCTAIDSVATAVRRVWASLFSDRALAYALHRKQHPHGMAVIIQHQVDAAFSGVMFTRDPRSQYADSVLVEYCAGLGDQLVAGQIVPGRLRIARANASVFVEQRPDQEPAADIANAKFASELLRVAKELEALFDAALDIEWSVDTAGRLIVLQARPITGQAVSAPVVIWSNANIAENFPEPVCPLLHSFVGCGYSAYFRTLGVAFGIPKQRMAEMTDALDQIVGSHAGRLYYNLSNIHTVIHLAPCGHWLTRFFNQFTGAEDFPVPRRLVQSRLRQWFDAVSVAMHMVWRYLQVHKYLRTFEQRVDDYAAASAPAQLGRKSAAELAGLMQRFLDIRLQHWLGGALADTAAMVGYGVLKLFLRGLPDLNANDLLKGLPHLASAVPVERLWDLSRLLRANTTLHTLIRQHSAEAVRARLQAGDYPEFSMALNDYLDRWGFRYSGELMLARPTPQEDLLPVIRLLKRYAEMEGDGPAEISQRQTCARIEATRVLRHRFNPLRAFVFGLILKAAQGAIRLRERARMKQALLYTRLRHVALALGDVQVREGRLERRDDVLYLRMDEAISLGQGSIALAGALRGIVATRRAALAACLNRHPPDRFTLPMGAEWQVDDDAGRLSQADVSQALASDVLTGIGACGGRFCGTAAVVLDVADIGCIHDDQILVTRQTDPGWAAVFFMIKGLVIERGGMLSHGAIIAREYGIPAVVGVRDATRLIENGQTILVCGDTGRVERVRG